MSVRWLWVAVVSMLPAAGLLGAPVAAADCISSAGTTLCSQGEVRGGDTGEGPGSLNTGGPWVPYPCENDWTCGWDNGFGVTFGFW